MIVYKCDRCGREGKHNEMFCLSVLNAPNNDGKCLYGMFPSMIYLARKILCEQCYQTIKEVLEDETIK